jgi:hypothetical protein|eukprot:scaffold10220_cov272-Chaetoceros_neogracile.AAC.39
MTTASCVKKVFASPYDEARDQASSDMNMNEKKHNTKLGNTVEKPLAHFYSPNLPPKIERKALFSAYYLTRSRQTVCSARHSEGTFPSSASREASLASSRGEDVVSKQTNSTPTRSNVSPDAGEVIPEDHLLESSILQQQKHRKDKSRSLLRRLKSVLHRSERKSLLDDDDDAGDDDLGLDEEIPIQDVFCEFSEKKMPPPVSRPSTPALKEYSSDDPCVIIIEYSSPDARPAPPPPTSSKLHTRITSVDSSPVPSVTPSESSMSSVTCDSKRCRLRGLHKCSQEQDHRDFPKEMNKNANINRPFSTRDATSTKSSDFVLFLSCMESAVETFSEGFVACSPSRNGKHKNG